MALPHKKILISQPEPISGRSPYHEIAKRFGYEIDFRQLIKTVPIEATEFRKQRIDLLSLTAISFTSKTIVDCFFQLLKELRITMPDTMKYFCTNEQVALYLQKYIVYRKRKIFFGESGRLGELVDLMVKGNHAKEKYFVPTSEDQSDGLPVLLADRKLHIQEGVVYRTITREMPEGMPADYDLLLFFSPYGIRALLELVPDFKQGKSIIGAFGELTSSAVEEAGLRLDFNFIAPTEEYKSMAGALEYYLEQHEKPAK